VLAGPGTGKSFTSVLFLQHLAREDPEFRTRKLTFTRAATAEFAEKMGDAGLDELGVAPPGTVHSFALSLLMRTEGVRLPWPLRIPDTWEIKKLIRPQLSRILKRLGHSDATPGVVEKLESEMAAGWQSLDPVEVLYADRNPALGAAYSSVGPTSLDLRVCVALRAAISGGACP
jgi:superfamily I DNA/RNA helicase